MGPAGRAERRRRENRRAAAAPPSLVHSYTSSAIDRGPTPPPGPPSVLSSSVKPLFDGQHHTDSSWSCRSPKPRPKSSRGTCRTTRSHHQAPPRVQRLHRTSLAVSSAPGAQSRPDCSIRGIRALHSARPPSTAPAVHSSSEGAAPGIGPWVLGRGGHRIPTRPRGQPDVPRLHSPSLIVAACRPDAAHPLSPVAYQDRPGQ